MMIILPIGCIALGIVDEKNIKIHHMDLEEIID